MAVTSCLGQGRLVVRVTISDRTLDPEVSFQVCLPKAIMLRGTLQPFGPELEQSYQALCDREEELLRFLLARRSGALPARRFDSFGINL
jgi:hypothetical protein